MTTINTDHRSVAVLKLPTKIQVLITYAHGIATALTNNPSFPTLTPTLATLSAAIADLQTAETAALARAAARPGPLLRAVDSSCTLAALTPPWAPPAPRAPPARQRRPS